jgi:excisionase family DNA binding protein
MEVKKAQSGDYLKYSMNSMPEQIKGGIMKRKVYKQIEVAKMIGVHRNSVYRWVRDGKIKSVLVAGVRMIPASEIEKLTGEE